MSFLAAIITPEWLPDQETETTREYIIKLEIYESVKLPTLEQYQKWVNGWIEVFCFKQEYQHVFGQDGYCNEEYTYQEPLMPPNYLVWPFTASLICGPAVLMGGVDEEGENTGLTRFQVESIKNLWERTCKVRTITTEKIK